MRRRCSLAHVYRATLGVALGVGMLLTSTPASADVTSSGSGAGDFARVLADGMKWARTFRRDARDDTRAARAESDAQASLSTTYGESADRRPPVILLARENTAKPALAERGTHRKAANGVESAWPELRASIVARDWSGSLAVFGDDLPSDNIRLTRSSRMLLGRIATGEGRIKPFAHLGVGEWRYDPYLMPLMPRNQEYATQFSGGVSVELWKGATFVWETDYTVLVRDTREPQNLPTPHVLGSFAILETRL